jgi:hypothetical protein
LLGHVGGVFGVLFQTPFLSPIRFDDSAHMVSIRLVKLTIASRTPHAFNPAG